MTTPFIHKSDVACPLCGNYLVHSTDEEGRMSLVHQGRPDSRDSCPNAGKKFKVPTIDLEEISPCPK